MAPRSWLIALLLCIPGLAHANRRTVYLVLKGTVDCAGAAEQAATVPKNSLLIAFDPKNRWLQAQKTALIANVNQLLKFYGFPIEAKAVSVEEARRIESLSKADAAVKYTANSFVAGVGVLNDWISMGQAQTDIHAVAYNDDDNKDPYVFGATHPEDIEKIGILLNSSDVPDPARERAILAFELTHEFIHAAQIRAIGAMTSGSPKPNFKPWRVMPKQAMFGTTDALFAKLGIGRKTGHMAEGIMVGGLAHHGDRNDDAGGLTGGLAECLKDPRIKTAELGDLGALARSGRKCSTLNFPVSDYFRLPDKNIKLIGHYFENMKTVGCYAPGYYRSMRENDAAQAVGYAGPPLPQSEESKWYEAFNR